MLAKQFAYKKAANGTGRMVPDQEELILRYGPLIKTIALRLRNRLPNHVDVEDLITAGVIGLIDAAKKYDPSRGIPFSSYAKTRIRGAMLDEIRAMDWVPRTVRQKTKEIESCYRKLEDRLGREPTDEEISKEMGIPIEEYYGRLDEIRPISFLPDEILDIIPGDTQLSRKGSDLNSPFLNMYRKELKCLLSEAISTLTEREKQVLALYYQEELTMKEIGIVLGCSESRVCQIHNKIILKLRIRLRHKLKKDDLPRSSDLEEGGR